MKDIINIINTKLKEHIDELEATKNASDKLRKEIKDNNIEQAQQIMILKDKMMFHKTCTLILQDVLDDYEKGKE